MLLPDRWQPAGSLCLFPFFLFLSWCSVRRVGEDSNPNSLVRHGQFYKYYAGKGAGVPCSYRTAGTPAGSLCLYSSFFSCPGVVFAVSAKIPIQIHLSDTDNATNTVPARVPAFHEKIHQNQIYPIAGIFLCPILLCQN